MRIQPENAGIGDLGQGFHGHSAAVALQPFDVRPRLEFFDRLDHQAAAGARFHQSADAEPVGMLADDLLLYRMRWGQGLAGLFPFPAFQFLFKDFVFVDDATEHERAFR